MQQVMVSINLEGPIVQDIGTFAKRLNMTDLEYIRNGIMYFNSLNKRKHLINQVQSSSIIGQEKSSKILRELAEQQKSQIIL